MTLDPQQRLEQVRAELDAELERLNDAGLCGCACGKLLPPQRSSRQRYIFGHRDRAHKRRVRLEAEALGVRVQQSHQSLKATASTPERRGDAPAARKRPQRRPRPGVSLYLPRPELVATVLDALERDRDLCGDAPWREPGELDRIGDAIAAVTKARDRLERRR